MPVKDCKVHVHDAPWITVEFKNLIKLRQQAFMSGDKERYCRYRNAVNRERKTLRSKYFASKINNLKFTKPSQWRNAVKRVALMVPCSSSDSLLSSLHLDVNVDEHEIANKINSAFLAPMGPFQPLDADAVVSIEEDPHVLTLTEPAVLAALKNVIHAKQQDLTASLTDFC